jgi:hypothetical protein
MSRTPLRLFLSFMLAWVVTSEEHKRKKKLKEELEKVDIIIIKVEAE